jgi:hypothetical protein
MSRDDDVRRGALRLARTFVPAALLLAAASQAQIAVRNQGYIPYEDAPIFYRSDDIDDPVTRLQKRLERGEARLDYDPKRGGYLASVLELLDIPVSSQTLVFSKTSFQYPKISPEHPRALYFNDDVYVGVVNEGKEIEVIAFDARQGAIFFILHEQQVENPGFDRAELDCTQCHIAAGTRGVPGVLIRSVHPAGTGTPVPGSRSFITDQDSPFPERWGGWYVTGTRAGATMANAVAAPDGKGRTPRLEKIGTTRFDPSRYLASTSDEVALMVLAHQTQMHNLITLVNYRTRIGQHRSSDPEAVRAEFERPVEQLLRYLLFANEAPLPPRDADADDAPSAFAREFAARGPRDSRGRSLRDFDLGTRLFRHPCSYLIYSEAFDAIPEPARSHVWARLLEILTGQDESGDFDGISETDRRAVLEILLETKPGLPRAWHDHARAHGLRTTIAGDRITQGPDQRGHAR